MACYIEAQYNWRQNKPNQSPIVDRSNAVERSIATFVVCMLEVTWNTLVANKPSHTN